VGNKRRQRGQRGEEAQVLGIDNAGADTVKSAQVQVSIQACEVVEPTQALINCHRSMVGTLVQIEKILDRRGIKVKRVIKVE
jgi:hypothetical protein